MVDILMFEERPPDAVQASNGNDVPPPDPQLQDFERLRTYARSGKIPWRKVSSRKREDLCNSALLTPYDVGERNGIAFPLRDHRFVNDRTYKACLKARFMTDIADASIRHLKKTMPEYSASSSLSILQKLLAIIALILLAWSLFTFSIGTLIAINAVVTAYFLLAIGYRALLLVVGADPVSAEKAHPPADLSTLPVITVLLPLYRDADALPSLADAINQIDYPREKMDVKLLLEEDDTETIAEACRLGLDQQFDLIAIPDGGPRTKPKACNFGMHLARGDLIVIYDAEDQPEPDQLLKAARAFEGADEKLACVQARLNYYNHSENWLTRMFTLEYSLWFDWLLPALQRLNVPIPLGGTSNFFRTETLIKIGGWDPFNVTEDADLGLRISKMGYRVEILPSTTFEEANCQLGNWIRQRSRWMKGYMQTWLVHMRHPDRILKTTGWRGLLSVQLFIAGNVLSALINPILWTVFLAWLLTSASVISAVFPEPLLTFNLFALTFGNLFFVTMAVIAPLKRGWPQLCLAGLTAPIYWLLTSIAAYKALWQIFFQPHYWEKTDHVISEMAIARREQAMRKSH
ncbi:MAG: glycosyltransferase family 2 protein [Hyphococcus sp.]